MHKNIYAGLFVLAAVFLPKAAGASVSLVFQNGGNATTTPGTTVSITGTITNNATSSVVYLNSIGNLNIIPSNSIASATLGTVLIDEATSKSYLPMILNAGAQYINVLVKVNVSSSAMPGDYLGMYTLNAGVSTATNEYTQTQYFMIHVSGTSSGSNAGASSGSYTGGLQMPGGLQMGVDENMSAGTGLQMPGGLQFQDDLNLSEAMYQSGPRLIKLEGAATVYWVNVNNLKIPMWTDSVFNSYKNNSEEVQAVAQEEFDYYQNAKYIRLIGNSRIYKTEGKTKRFIPSAVWNPAGIDASLIIDVNKTDLNSYKTGKSLTSTEELN